MQPDSQSTQTSPSTAEILTQLDRILGSQPFVDSPKLAEFLRYVVDETLAGRAGRIKGFTIAQEVYGRHDVEDAQSSTVVRVEAGRLRRYLDDYYAANENSSCVRIEIPKGTYVPNFQNIVRVDQDLGNSKLRVDVESQTTSPPANRYFPSKLASMAIGGFAIVLVCGIFVSIYLGRPVSWNEPKEASSGSVVARPSIVVMPFKNLLEGSQAGDDLAKGLTEDVITDLSRLSGVNVMALASVEVLGSRADPETVLNKLNVSHVLRGSIRGKPSRIRITAQLYDTRTKNQVWADRFDRELHDLLELEDELAVKIAQGLSIKFDPGAFKKLSQHGQSNLEAYALFTQALHLVNPPTEVDRLKLSRAAFEKIIRLDSNFAGGYAGVAYTNAFLAFWGHSTTPQDEIKTAIELAHKAIDKDESFGLAYSALAFAYVSLGDFDKALAASIMGASKQPNDPYGSAYHGYLLAANGRAQEGVGFVKRALFLDPLNPRTPYLNILGFVYLLAGEPGQALASLVRSIERGGPVSPSNTVPRVIALVSLGRLDEAKTLADSLQRMDDTYRFQAWVDWVNRTIKLQEDKDKLFDPLKEIGLL
jgi:TolB-like protein/Flp pilus assembly protein TadD